MNMSATTVIARPVKDVIAYVSDVRNDVNWRTGVIEAGLKSGDVLTIGTVGFARAEQAETVWRIVGHVAGRSFDWELVSGPFKGSGGYRFIPLDSGTQFTLVADIIPSGVYRMMGPLFAWIGRRQNQADVEKLRQILESA